MDNVAERRSLVKLLAARCSGAEIIVGEAAPSLPWACWVAEELGVPLAYVREAKQYGRQRTVEGADIRGKHVVVIGAPFPPLPDAASVRVVELARRAEGTKP